MPPTSSRLSQRINGVGSEHSDSSDISLSEQESHIDIVKVCIGKETDTLIRTG